MLLGPYRLPVKQVFMGLSEAGQTAAVIAVVTAQLLDGITAVREEVLLRGGSV